MEVTKSFYIKVLFSLKLFVIVIMGLSLYWEINEKAGHKSFSEKRMEVIKSEFLQQEAERIGDLKSSMGNLKSYILDNSLKLSSNEIWQLFETNQVLFAAIDSYKKLHKIKLPAWQNEKSKYLDLYRKLEKMHYINTSHFVKQSYTEATL
ncbi:MAG: hypothetical protein HOE90_20420 [Bacteriovoracaceae bacterium]|jgi:hypothetical protein|nr:hypothetical protein [Bacteriovoracaceae bacterium]